MIETYTGKIEEFELSPSKKKAHDEFKKTSLIGRKWKKLFRLVEGEWVIVNK